MNTLKPLSKLLSEEVIARLRSELRAPQYEGVEFEQAMAFFLTDGILPRSRAKNTAFLALEDWLRAQGVPADATYTASELKNKTGEILEHVGRGKTIAILKHGREIARLVPAALGS